MAKTNRIGSWAFLIGVILAVVLGLIGNPTSMMVGILVVLGLIVGFLNVAGNEASTFLMSGAVLIIASAFGSNVLGAIPQAGAVLQALMAVFVPATVIVAIKNVFSVARN